MDQLSQVEAELLKFRSGVVLVVDDEEDTRNIVSLALQKFGHTILQAKDGEEALSICRQDLPDVIVSDIMMPRMDGIEFLRIFREEFSETFVPVLMLTAKGDIQDLISGLEKGADDYLTKPFNYKELAARVNALLRIKTLTERLYEQREELREKNEELFRMQQELIKKERQLVAMQLAGAASHNLGQPITTILLNCKMLEGLLDADNKDSKLKLAQAAPAVESIKHECETLREVVDNLRKVDAERTEDYLGDVSILSLKKDWES